MIADYNGTHSFIIPIAALLDPVSALMCDYFQQRGGTADLVYQEIYLMDYWYTIHMHNSYQGVTGQETSASFCMISCALIGLVAISQIKN